MGGRLLRDPEGERIDCIDPRSGESVAQVACTPLDELARMVDRARQAQRAWHDLGLKRRRWAVSDLHQAFLAAAPDLVALLEQELGRPQGESWTSEILATGDLFAWWLRRMPDLLLATPLDLDPLSYRRKRGRVQLDPVGLVGLVTPWNLPVAIPLRTIVPALLVGDGVIWKPSEHSPRSAAFVHELCRRTLPSELVQLVQGGAEQGAAVVEAPVDAVCFTGSVATGRQVAASCAPRFLPCSLELGGKDAAVVLADADLERTVEGVVWAAFGLSGQNCAAVERCYVDAAIYEDFVDRVVARTARLRPLLDLGPLITRAQLGVVQEHVADAVARGATLRAGGQAPGPGWYHQPTVLTEVDPTMKVMAEETFGPVLPIVPFDDLERALQAVDASPFGLTTSFWTRDLELGETLACNVRVGVGTVNNHAFTGAIASAAWGGPKATGHGTTNSRFALSHLVRPRTVLVDALSQPHELWWFPYNDALEGVASGLVELTRKGGAKLPGARAALSGFIARWKERP